MSQSKKQRPQTACGETRPTEWELGNFTEENLEDHLDVVIPEAFEDWRKDIKERRKKAGLDN